MICYPNWQIIYCSVMDSIILLLLPYDITLYYIEVCFLNKECLNYRHILILQ